MTLFKRLYDMEVASLAKKPSTKKEAKEFEVSPVAFVKRYLDLYFDWWAVVVADGKIQQVENPFDVGTVYYPLFIITSTNEKDAYKQAHKWAKEQFDGVVVKAVIPMGLNHPERNDQYWEDEPWGNE